MSRILSPRESGYHGPGWADWLLGFAATVMLGFQLRGLGEAKAPQSGLRYYMERSGNAWMHGAAAWLDALLLILVVVLVFRGKPMRSVSAVLLGLAVLGIALCWWELALVVSPAPAAGYTLEGLPYSTVNNMGVVGAQILGSYIIVKAPMGVLSGWFAGLIKLLLVAALLVGQYLAWDALSRGVLR